MIVFILQQQLKKGKVKWIFLDQLKGRKKG
jgi:hypothetical protein